MRKLEKLKIKLKKIKKQIRKLQKQTPESKLRNKWKIYSLKKHRAAFHKKHTPAYNAKRRAFFGM